MFKHFKNTYMNEQTYIKQWNGNSEIYLMKRSTESVNF